MSILNSIWAWMRSKPKEVLVAVILLLCISTSTLFWLRANGKTIQLPFVDKYITVVPVETSNAVTAGQLNRYSKIVGKYKYRCKSNIKNHGGVCSISLTSTEAGLQWQLNGERRWEELKDS